MDQPAVIAGLVALCGLWISLVAYGWIGPKPGNPPLPTTPVPGSQR